jgi:hypothetical protein
MGKTVVSWIDITKAHAKLNPGKSLKVFLPAAQKEWKLIKAGLHPTKMAKTASSDIKNVVKLVKSKKTGKKSKGSSKKSRRPRKGSKKRGKSRKNKKGGSCAATASEVPNQ